MRSRVRRALLAPPSLFLTPCLASSASGSEEKLQAIPPCGLFFAEQGPAFRGHAPIGRGMGGGGIKPKAQAAPALPPVFFPKTESIANLAKCRPPSGKAIASWHIRIQASNPPPHSAAVHGAVRAFSVLRRLLPNPQRGDGQN